MEKAPSIWWRGLSVCFEGHRIDIIQFDIIVKDDQREEIRSKGKETVSIKKIEKQIEKLSLEEKQRLLSDVLEKFREEALKNRS